MVTWGVAVVRLVHLASPSCQSSIHILESVVITSCVNREVMQQLNMVLVAGVVFCWVQLAQLLASYSVRWWQWQWEMLTQLTAM